MFVGGWVRRPWSYVVCLDQLEWKLLVRSALSVLWKLLVRSALSVPSILTYKRSDQRNIYSY